MAADRDVFPIEEFLRGHVPFSGLDTSLRRRVAESMTTRHCLDGEVIVQPADGRVRDLFVIAEGHVEGERLGHPADSESVELATGDSFPIGALLGERETRTIYRSQGETLLLRLPGDVFISLFTHSDSFRNFCLRGVSSLLDQVHGQIQGVASRNLAAESTFDLPLAHLLKRPAVRADGGTSTADAVRLMHEERVGSVVIADGDDRPSGIFTLHDLRAVIARGVSLDTPLEQVMTANPKTLEGDALAFEAVLIMAREHIRHIVVTRGGKLAGVVSERDMFALQQIDVVQIMRRLSGAESIEALAQTRGGIQRLIDGLLAHGAGAEQLVRLITLLNDRTVTRAIEICLEGAEPPGVAFTWIAFGSEGRSEQTLVTDQDNGILFVARDEDPEAVRGRLIPLARRINEALDRCGFPLCKGNIMASNPELCLSFDEWEETFRRIIASNTPQNLLRSSIYFDFRPIWGDPRPVEKLQRRVLEKASGNSLFRRMMAGNALINRPPLGMLRDFITERSGDDDRATLDLKMRGLTPFVDGARLLALEGALPQTNTLERLRAVGRAGLASAREVDAWSRSFAYLQLFRMRLHQEQARAGQPMTNRLDPDMLNTLDRRILKECFRQARALQKKLELRYQI